MEDRNWQKVDEWMKLYGDRLIRVIYLLINNYHVAEEITQEVFVKAYSNMGSFRGDSSPYTWLYRVALNLSKNHLSRKSRIWFIPFKNVERENRITEPLEDIVISLDINGRVRGCILKLPLIYREVIILYYFEDLKVSEIAQVLEQPEGTVKSKLFRGRELLEDIIRKEGLADGR
ncbi:MAG: sigma-70 family RNA polymerase sigma factor [Desulfitobacteriaceae bacterium]|nr:sigma-70 family RNA polymerase sigma factor [Desulfitobacteriaceae bacterium]MDD3874886.1 sigma-70 family RNA polymerase sigma factor [Methanosarcina sp.]MDD4753900.1 sigma-70 family RNA polymerase sigma factor [Desulfitobacteriaceae bacterium]